MLTLLLFTRRILIAQSRPLFIPSGGWPTFALFYRYKKPAAPAFVISEGCVFGLIDQGDLDGMRHDPV